MKIFLPYEEPEFLEAWELWKTYKKEEFGFKYKSKISEQAALKKLARLSKDFISAIAIMEQSIENGWKGFFELKENGRKERLTKEQQQYLVSRRDI